MVKEALHFWIFLPLARIAAETKPQAEGLPYKVDAKPSQAESLPYKVDRKP